MLTVDYLNTTKQYKIGISTSPFLEGNIFLSILSVICSLLTVGICFSLKYCHSVLYRLFLCISISEVFNGLCHIIQSLITLLKSKYEKYTEAYSEKYSLNIVLTILIYSTDAFSLVFLARICFSIYMLILKQGKKSSEKFYKILSIFIPIVTTLIYIVILFLNDLDDIYYNIINWKFLHNLKYKKKFSTSISIFFTMFVYLILIIFSFRNILKIDNFIKKKIKEDEKQQNVIRLQKFTKKIYNYPLLGIIWAFPLFLYSMIEFFDNQDLNVININFIRLKNFFYGINCFISSIRGFLFFQLFASNEKIRKYISHKLEIFGLFNNIIFIKLKNDLYNILSQNQLSINEVSDIRDIKESNEERKSKNTKNRKNRKVSNVNEKEEKILWNRDEDNDEENDNEDEKGDNKKVLQVGEGDNKKKKNEEEGVPSLYSEDRGEKEEKGGKDNNKDVKGRKSYTLVNPFEDINEILYRQPYNDRDSKSESGYRTFSKENHSLN